MSEVGVGEGDVAPTTVFEEYVWQENHEERFSYLFKTAKLSDVKLILGSKAEPMQTFQAHRLILIAGSPVFAKMLENAENIDCVEIREEIDPVVFADFLKFLYVGKLEQLDAVKSTASLIQLMQLALKYGVKDLGNHCVTLLMDHLNDGSAIALFQLAAANNLSNLRQTALCYICRNAMDLIETEKFLELTYDNLCLLVSSDHLEIFNELQLFNAVIRWAERECQRKSIETTAINIRLVLGAVLKLIRYPTMDQKDFTLNVAAKDILQLDDLVSVLLSFTLPIEQRCLMSEGKFSGAVRRYTEEKIRDWKNYCTVLSRFPDVKVSTAIRALDTPDTLRFCVDRNIRLMTVGAVGFQSKGGVLEASISIEDEDQKTLVNKSECMVSNDSQLISFERGCKIAANRWHSISVLLNNSAIDSIPFVGYGGNPVYTVKLAHMEHHKSKNLNVVFKFKADDDQGGGVNSGIIDEFHFMLI